MENETRLTRLAALCGRERYDENDEFALEYAQRIIKNYCQRDEVCDELEETLIDMAAEIRRTAGWGEEAKTGAVKEISEGDMKVIFESESGEGIFDIKNYSRQLNNFRRPKW